MAASSLSCLCKSPLRARLQPSWLSKHLAHCTQGGIRQAGWWVGRAIEVAATVVAGGAVAGLVVASRHPPRSQARVRARCRQCHGKAVGPRFRECHCQGAAAAAGCDGRAVA
eukprot:scaffold103370_cov17-Tisochrysis_lutea.AAC.1